MERATWSAIRISVGNRCVTTIHDRELGEERQSLHLPAFPIAEWLVHQWWFLLYELSPVENPLDRSTADHWNWLGRHCLRCADSALLLPKLAFYSDDKSVIAQWLADDSGVLPHMPGEFISSGLETLDRQETESALAQFVERVLRRVQSLNFDRVHKTVERWRAIQSQGCEERDFCISAARMGLDAYDPDAIDDATAGFLEQHPISGYHALIHDLTEIANPESLLRQWDWIDDVHQRLPLKLGNDATATDSWRQIPKAHLHGYKLAQDVRQQLDIRGTHSIPSIPDVCRQLANRDLIIDHAECHAPRNRLRALVGTQTNGTGVVVAASHPRHATSERFLIARALYLMLASGNRNTRLLTDALSWDQRASRAFAAELLAPQSALIEDLDTDDASLEEIERLAAKYQVSTRVIENQLQNQGITVLPE